MFNGLEQIIMYVIKNSGHSDELLTPEQRYDNVMNALFGDYYPRHHIKPPAGSTLEEVMDIRDLNRSGVNISRAVRKVTSMRFQEMKKNKNADSGRMALHKAAIESILKHFNRKKDHYDNFHTIESDEDLDKKTFLTQEQKEEAIQARKDIFAALTAAGW